MPSVTNTDGTSVNVETLFEMFDFKRAVTLKPG